MIVRILTVAMLLNCAGFANSLSISLRPASGPLEVSPGQVGGWGFNLKWNSTTDWLTVTGSALTGETNSSLITGYTDFIGWQGGPANYALAPNNTWTEAAFDATSQTGIGAITINSSEPAFAQDAGTLMVFYQTYTGDPTNGGSLISTSSVSVPFMVQVAEPSSVPEPGSVLLCFFGIGSLAVLVRIGICKFREPEDNRGDPPSQAVNVFSRKPRQMVNSPKYSNS